MAANPFYNKCRLLLHFDGSDGGTTFTDSSPSEIVPTANGTITTSTAQKVFGTASLAVLKNGDLTISAAQMPGPGSGDFTVRCWARFVTASGAEQRGVFQMFGGGYVGGVTGNVAVFVGTGSVWCIYAGGAQRTTAVAVSTGQWYFISVVREKGVTSFYVDGEKLLSFTDTTVYGGGGVIGGYSSSGFRADGYIDEFEIYYYAVPSSVPDVAPGDWQATISGEVTVGGTPALLRLRASERSTGRHLGDTYSGATEILSPTTWNPSDKSPNAVLSNGNLQFQGNVNDGARSVFGASEGKWYWEITVVSYYGGVITGVAKADANINGYPGKDANGWAYYGYASGGTYHNATYNDAYTTVGAGTGAVIGVALDLDSGTLGFYVDGVYLGVAFTGLSGTFYAMTGGSSSGPTETVLANFGATPFAYSVPTGFVSGFGDAIVISTPTGEYSMAVSTLEECHVICMDADGGTLENDLIHRVMPA